MRQRYSIVGQETIIKICFRLLGCKMLLKSCINRKSFCHPSIVTAGQLFDNLSIDLSIVDLYVLMMMNYE